LDYYCTLNIFLLRLEAVVDEIVESLQDYGQVSHNLEAYGDNYIEQFMMLGNRTTLDKGQFNYVYSSAWEQ